MLPVVNDVGHFFLYTFIFLVTLILVPAIFLLLLLLAYLISFDNSSNISPNQRNSRILAFILGIVLFISLVVATLFVGPFQPISFDGTLGSLLALLGIGVLAGLLLMFVIDVLKNSRVASIFVTILSCTSLTGFYYYIQSGESRNPILIVILGLLIGGLIYGAYISSTVVGYFQVTNFTGYLIPVGILAVVISLGAASLSAINYSNSHNSLQPPRIPTTLPSATPKT